MTYEEMQKTMQFILEQQAQFTANQQQVGERVSRLETNMAEMSREVSQVTREVGQMTRVQAHMNEVVAAMLDTHRQTEEKLDAFIGVLERYISEGRNGKGGGKDAA